MASIDRLITNGFGTSTGPDAPRPLITDPLYPMSKYGSPVTLLKFQMAPKLIILMSSGSEKMEARYVFLNEAAVSHSQRMWTEVSSFTPYLLHSGLFDSPSR